MFLFLRQIILIKYIVFTVFVIMHLHTANLTIFLINQLTILRFSFNHFLLNFDWLFYFLIIFVLCEVYVETKDIGVCLNVFVKFLRCDDVSKTSLSINSRNLTFCISILWHSHLLLRKVVLVWTTVRNAKLAGHLPPLVLRWPIFESL